MFFFLEQCLTTLFEIAYWVAWGDIAYGGLGKLEGGGNYYSGMLKVVLLNNSKII